MEKTTLEEARKAKDILLKYLDDKLEGCVVSKEELLYQGEEYLVWLALRQDCFLE